MLNIILKSLALFLLLLLAVTSISQAEENQSYKSLVLNEDDISLSAESDKNSDENTSKQSDARDCDALTYEITLFSPCEGEDSRRLWRQTKIIVVAGFSVAAFIAMLPEDVSGWDKSEYESGDLLKNWYENVKAGPVWDEDDWYFNIIGHTYFGGVYYQAARKSGYNQWNSFTYSALMSTFYYEYGIEAFAEIPSIQDLVVTPVGGWIYGEWAHHKEKAIIKNGGLAMGSQFWGSVALFLLDPVGKFDEWCCISKKVEVTAFNIAHWPAQQHSQDINAGKDYWGIKLALEF